MKIAAIVLIVIMMCFQSKPNNKMPFFLWEEYQNCKNVILIWSTIRFWKHFSIKTP